MKDLRRCITDDQKKSKETDKVLTYIKRGNLEVSPCVVSDIDIFVDNLSWYYQCKRIKKIVELLLLIIL